MISSGMTERDRSSLSDDGWSWRQSKSLLRLNNQLEDLRLMKPIGKDDKTRMIVWLYLILPYLAILNLTLLVRLLRISRSPYVWCWPFRSSFPFRKHSKPYHCWKEGLLLFGCCKGIAFRLSASLCNSNSPRGLIFFSLASPVAEKGPFPLLQINPILSRGLMPVFEASESIVSTFPALILVLILVVLDSVSPTI